MLLRFIRSKSTNVFFGDITKTPFVVGATNGFLPAQEPLEQLPSQFSKLESLLQRMPLETSPGKKGLLATGQFGPAVDKELPVYDVKNIQDSQLLSALFRDYTFVASSYLLEPCDIEYRKTGSYGFGRKFLPPQIAVPLVTLADKIGAKPFMEYALSYALINYRRLDKNKGYTLDNMELIRKFSGSESERGFILVHIAMVAHSGALVKGIKESLDACGAKDMSGFKKGLESVLAAMQNVNDAMETMWKHSSPDEYIDFRTFIMGTKNQPMFPDGVVYKGTQDETPRFYRGESGANDSMIPTCDNFLELTSNMPKNPLTDILKDFRSYRPMAHNQWLQYVESTAAKVGVAATAKNNKETALLYLQLLNQVREFRFRHWLFTKEYIIKHTTHPVATGGSPIVTWLPNQLFAVLSAMDSVRLDKNTLSPSEREIYDICHDYATTQRKVLQKDVKVLGEKLGRKAVDAGQ